MLDAYLKYQQNLLTTSFTAMLDTPPEGFFDFFASEIADDLFVVLQKEATSLQPINPANIPQFSNIDEIDTVLRILIESGEQFSSYNSLGYYMCPRGANVAAQSKYGENHYKTAALLGLTRTGTPLSATGLGTAYHSIQDSDFKLAIRKRLTLRIPIVQQALFLAESPMSMTDLMAQHLATSTVARRKSNVKTLLQYVCDVSGPQMQHRISNIMWG